MPKGVPHTEEDQIRRRRGIFEVAARLFSKKGFAETSMREIAEAAGVGKSTLYDYFAKKDDLLLFFIEEEMRLLNQTTAESAGRAMDAPTKLRQLTELQFEFLERNRAVALLLVREAQRLGPQSQRWWMEKRQEYLRLLHNVIEQGISERAFREVDPAFSARALMGLMTLIFLEGVGGSPAEMAARSLDIFLNGIRADAHG
jgi:TetR/AcrR family fatty acid metabolism transcriptional regulator